MKYDYWAWKKIISKKDIILLNKIIEKEFSVEEPIERGATDKKGEFKKTCKVLLCKYGKIKNLLNNVYNEALESNSHNFGYSLFPLTDFSFCNLNIYSDKNNQKYDWHVDEASGDRIDMKLTLLINLSIKKYEGGEFLIFKTNEYVVKDFSEPGDMLMFKSSINHKVSPIISGERRTLAIFLHGPRFI